MPSSPTVHPLFYDSAKNSTSLANESTPTVVFFIKNLIVQYTYQQVHEQIAMIIPPIYTTRRYIRLFVSTDYAVLLWKKLGCAVKEIAVSAFNAVPTHGWERIALRCYMTDGVKHDYPIRR